MFTLDKRMCFPLYIGYRMITDTTANMDTDISYEYMKNGVTGLYDDE